MNPTVTPCALLEGGCDQGLNLIFYRLLYLLMINFRKEATDNREQVDRRQ